MRPPCFWLPGGVMCAVSRFLSIRMPVSVIVFATFLKIVMEIVERRENHYKPFPP